MRGIVQYFKIVFGIIICIAFACCFVASLCGAILLAVGIGFPVWVEVVTALVTVFGTAFLLYRLGEY